MPMVISTGAVIVVAAGMVCATYDTILAAVVISASREIDGQNAASKRDGRNHQLA